MYTHFSTAVADDISLPDPFEVVLSVGQTESTGCIDVPITSDTELEGDHDFTVTITSAGSVPHASIGDVFISSITIDDDEGDKYFLFHLGELILVVVKYTTHPLYLIFYTSI